jgi:hypothetical protein
MNLMRRYEINNSGIAPADISLALQSTTMVWSNEATVRHEARQFLGFASMRFA